MPENFFVFLPQNPLQSEKIAYLYATMTAWILWLIVAAVLVTVEVMTQMVWTLCLAIGCAGALAASLCGAGVTVQIATMAVTAMVAYVVLVPYFRRLHHRIAERDGNRLRTGMDALIGKEATVIKSIEAGGMGRVKADGDNWQAVARHPDISFRVGERVRIHSYDSIILTVEPI